MTQIKAAIFDLDGTLVNSLTDIALSMNTALEALGYPTHKTQKYKDFIGSGVRTLARKAIAEDKKQDEKEIDKLLSLYNEIYSKSYLDNTVAYDGIEKMLKTLCEKIPVCVLSNKPHKDTKEIVKSVFKDIDFKIVYGQREGIPKKPDPYAIFEIAKELNIKPEEIMYVGDAGVDIKTGISAGALTVGVLWGFRQRSELEENGARYLVSDANGITQIYDNFAGNIGEI